MSEIEHSNRKGKFTEAELRRRIAESKKFWASPAGRVAAAEAEKRAARCKNTPTRFPDLAGTTRPAIGTQTAKRSAEHPSITNARLRLKTVSRNI